MFSPIHQAEALHRLCQQTAFESAFVFCSYFGRNFYDESLALVARDLAGEPELRRRRELLERIQSWIVEAKTRGFTGFLKHVENVELLAFGSSVMGICSRDGDLDISFEGTVRDLGISPTGRLSGADRTFKQNLLAEIHELLRSGRFFRHSKDEDLVLAPRVPVSKFVESATGIHCDLSISNATGVFLSSLLSVVLKLDQRVKDLVAIVKKWAKAHRLNDPTNGSYSSICLTLLVILFAQSRTPRLIPPFRELFPGSRDVCKSLKGGSVDLIHGIDFFKRKAGEWEEQCERPHSEETLCELLCEFFPFLDLLATHSQQHHCTAGVIQSFDTLTCSCWEGGFVFTEWDAKALKHQWFYVEDPFQAGENCARSLGKRGCERIVKTLQCTVKMVEEFVNAPPQLKLKKWTDLRMFLFQPGHLPQLPNPIFISDLDDVQPLKAQMLFNQGCPRERSNMPMSFWTQLETLKHKSEEGENKPPDDFQSEVWGICSPKKQSGERDEFLESSDDLNCDLHSIQLQCETHCNVSLQGALSLLDGSHPSITSSYLPTGEDKHPHDSHRPVELVTQVASSMSDSDDLPEKISETAWDGIEIDTASACSSASSIECIVTTQETIDDPPITAEEVEEVLTQPDTQFDSENPILTEPGYADHPDRAGQETDSSMPIAENSVEGQTGDRPDGETVEGRTEDRPDVETVGSENDDSSALDPRAAPRHQVNLTKPGRKWWALAVVGAAGFRFIMRNVQGQQHD